MKEDDKRMEEFFRQSMDKFDDSPSRDVWGEVSDRIASEETLMTKSKRWFRNALPFLALFFLFTAASLYSYATITKLKSQNSSLLIENEQLHHSISILNEDNATLKKTTTKLQNDLTIIRQEKKNIEFDIETSQKALANAIYQNSKLTQEFKLANILHLDYEKQLQTCMNQLEDYTLLSNNSKNQNKRLKESSLNPLSTHLAKGPILSKTNDPMERLLKQQTNKYKQYVEDEEEIKFFDLKYRYGITGRGFNTFVKNSNQINFGKSYGFIHELYLGRRWSLNHAVQYNEQEYTLESDRNGLSEEILKNFPDNPSAYANVSSVKAQAKYLDTHLGFKYQIPNKKKTGSYYISPSAVWQLYLPQEFSYNLVQAQDLLVQKRGYVGYFGSINLEFGMEKYLSEKMRFQLSIFAEKSLIELGHDKQNITLLGIKSSVLFGK